jgi:DNA-binding PadR family transcriptional regulator
VSRVFRSGELQRAVIAVLDEAGSANGYAIMKSLADRLDGRWRPSPGAVYPALLGLEDAGLVTTSDIDGTKVYRLSHRGASQAGSARHALDDVVARVRRQAPPGPTLGAVVDRFARQLPGRQRPLDPPAAEAVQALLDRLHRDLENITTKEST